MDTIQLKLGDAVGYLLVPAETWAMFDVFGSMAMQTLTERYAREPDQHNSSAPDGATSGERALR